MDRIASDFIQYLGHEFNMNRREDAYERLSAQRTKAANRSLGLARGEDLTPGTVACILSRATGDKVGQVIMVSSMRPPRGEVLAGDELIRIRSGLKIGEGLADRLCRCHEHAIKGSLSDSCRQDLRRRLNECLGDGLWSAFAASFPDGTWLKPMRAALYDNLWYSLYLYFGSLAAGLDERAERLKDLTRLVAYALPLCRRGEGGEWIMIAR